MRFLQLNKFSYLVRKLNGVERLPPGEDIFKNSKLYDKFLKSTLIETLITISFVFACIKFLILYNNLVDGTQFNYPSDHKLLFSNIFLDEILIKIYEELLKTVNSRINVWSLLTNTGFDDNAFNIASNKRIGKDKYLIVIKYMIEFGEKSSSLAESILDEKCKNTFTVKEESSLMFYLEKTKFSLDKLCFQSLRNKTQKVIVKLIGLEKKEHVKIIELESNFKVKKFIKKSYDLNVAKKINDFEFLIYLVVFCIFFVFYVIEELIEIVKYKVSYVLNYVNLVDFMIILLSARLLGFIFYKTSYQLNAIKTFEKYEKKTKMDSNFKFKFHAIIDKIEFYNDFLNPDTEINLAILQVILIWIKIFKYVNFSTGLTQMNAALTKSANHLISYLFIYSIVFCTHAEMMHRLFGPYEADFSHRILAQFTMFRMLLANINFKFIATNPGTQIIFFSFYMTIFIIFSGIFLAIISDSYSYASENYEPKPELDYFNFFKRRLKKYADFLRLDKVWSILKGFFYLVDSKNNNAQHINQLQDAKKASDFRSYLLNLNFDPVDIDTIFYQYNIYEIDAEKLDEFDQAEEESIVQRDTCNEIITKLDLTAKRIISLNSRKLTFCTVQTNLNFRMYEMDLQSIYSNKSFKLSGIDMISQRSFNLRATSSALPRVHSETNTVNDDVNNIDYDNVYTEFTTWKDYRKLKLELDNLDTYLNEIFNELLDVYQRKNLHSKNFV